MCHRSVSRCRQLTVAAVTADVATTPAPETDGHALAPRVLFRGYRAASATYIKCISASFADGPRTEPKNPTQRSARSPECSETSCRNFIVTCGMRRCKMAWKAKFAPSREPKCRRQRSRDSARTEVSARRSRQHNKPVSRCSCSRTWAHGRVAQAVRRCLAFHAVY